MKIRTIVNDLTLNGTEHPRGAKLEVEDDEGKRLVGRGLVLEIKGKKTPEPPELVETGKGKGDKK